MGAAIASMASLERSLRAIANGSYLRDIMPPLLDHAHRLADEVFMFDASPDGTPWVPVKKETGEALEETGAMRASISVERGPYSPNGFTIIVEYTDEKASYHHYGTRRGGPISEAVRRPFHPKRQRLGRWENVRKSSRMDPSSGMFGVAEHDHIPARPLLPIGGIQAPRWETALEETWRDSFENWLNSKAGF